MDAWGDQSKAAAVTDSKRESFHAAALLCLLFG
jgi:hypothetical protein